MALLRCVLIRKYVRSKVKVTAKYFCFIILFSVLLWIYKTYYFEEVPKSDWIKNTDKYYTKNYPFDTRANQTYYRKYRDIRKNICSRRFRSFNGPNGSKIGSKDFHLHQRCNQAPMHKIFDSFGQDFGRKINDPDFKERHNFQHYQSSRYLKSFKNPCFYKNVTLGQRTQSRDIVRLHCVPYFMIAGFPKCGTTDLWSKLKQHPQIAWMHAKEVNFFNKKQYDVLTIEDAVDSYQRTFGVSTEQIKKCVPENKEDHNPCITGDASVDTIFDNKFWRQLPGNEMAREPKLTNANFVHKVNPDMKIIVLLREPVERLYSDYIYMSSSIGYVPSPEDFHVTAIDRISNFTSCTRHRNPRACAYDVYDDWNIQSYKVRLSVGIYHVFLQDWLNVFPRQSVFIIKSEDTRGPNAKGMFMKIFKFLGLTIPTHRIVQELYSNEGFLNQRSKDITPMLTKTKMMLQNFYNTYNTEFKNLLPYTHY